MRIFVVPHWIYISSFRNSTLNVGECSPQARCAQENNLTDFVRFKNRGCNIAYCEKNTGLSVSPYWMGVYNRQLRHKRQVERGGSGANSRVSVAPALTMNSLSSVADSIHRHRNVCEAAKHTPDVYIYINIKYGIRPLQGTG